MVFIKRNAKGRNFTAFNKMLTDFLAKSPCQGLLVYPEGTRSHKPESLPLRRGMLRYAFEEKMVSLVQAKER